MRKFIILYIVLLSSTGLAASTKISDVLNQGSQAIDNVRVPKDDAPDKPNAHSISVTGTVTTPNGSTAHGFLVKVFVGKLGGAQVVGSTTTDEGGGYTVAFASNASVTVFVKVYCESTLLATSAPEYNVTEGAYFDVTVPSPKCSPGTLPKLNPSWPQRKAGK